MTIPFFLNLLLLALERLDVGQLVREDDLLDGKLMLLQGWMQNRSSF
jgi:hypothetical protein